MRPVSSGVCTGLRKDVEGLGRGTLGSRAHTGSISQPLAGPCHPVLPSCPPVGQLRSLGSLSTCLVLEAQAGEWGSGLCGLCMGTGAWLNDHVREASRG